MSRPEALTASRAAICVQGDEGSLRRERHGVNLGREAANLQHDGTSVLCDTRDIAQGAQAESEQRPERFGTAFDRLRRIGIGLADLVPRQLDVLIEYANEALEHLAARSRSQTQRHLGRQLPTKMALLISDRIRIDLIEELRQDIKRLCKPCFQVGRNGLGAVLDPTEKLLGHTDLRPQVRERQIVKEADESKVGADEFAHRKASEAVSPSSRRFGPTLGLST